VNTDIIENEEHRKNWGMFYTSVSRRWSDSPELDEVILQEARKGTPRKQIKKDIPKTRGYIDHVITRALRERVL
jgi:hypothetical protein